MKKACISILAVLIGLTGASTMAQTFDYPKDTNTGFKRVKQRTENQGYKVCVARKFLFDAYNDNKRNAKQKGYIANLSRKIESYCENNYRKTVWYEVVSDTEAHLYGQIDSSILQKTVDLLTAKPTIKKIKLIYVPGSHHDINNHKAGRLLRELGITIEVPSYGLIASGGTDLLMAGSPRIVQPGAQVGVHAWTSPSHPESWTLSINDTAHNEYLDYFTDMGISSDLYRWTLQNTRPGTIHWLTQDELNQYGF